MVFSPPPAPKLTEHVACVGAVLPADHGAALKVTILEEDAWNRAGKLTGGATRKAGHGSAQRMILSSTWEHSTFQTSLGNEA